MSLVKATAALNRIAGQYNLLEILNSNKCRRPDPETCSLTSQKIDQLQQVLTKIRLNYADDPMLSKLFALTVYSNNKKTLKGGRRHKNFKGGFKGILSVITLIISILIYVCVFKQDTMTKSELLQLKNITNTIKQCNSTNYINLSLEVDKDLFPVIATNNAGLMADTLERLKSNIIKYAPPFEQSRPINIPAVSATINIKYDKELGKQIFNFELIPLDKDISGGRDILALTEKYKAIDDLKHLEDLFSQIVFNIYASGQDIFFKVDDQAILSCSVDLFLNRKLPSELNPHGHHHDTGSYKNIVLTFYENNVGTHPEMFPLFAKHSLTNDPSVHPVVKKITTTSRSLTKKNPKVESLRLGLDNSKKYELVFMGGNPWHSSPSFHSTGTDVVYKNEYDPDDTFYSSAIGTHNSIQREIGDELLKKIYYQNSEEYGIRNNRESGRNFLRMIYAVLSKFENPMYDFWNQKISNMLQQLTLSTTPHPTAIAIVSGKEMPGDFVEKILEAQLKGQLAKASTVAPDECNQIVATPKSFADIWGALTGSPFAVGGRKNRNKTRKK